ncbi:MAG: TRZ/ATZ family hydrolase [Gammaproteobacteria bacterium]|nr:TRZ/ATZ family hydrolase [Gammaproteobacteria bacterium]MBT8050571.1 TRZ/ATZ family hydrolase [Gammaproteobacteria bacterium]NNJ80070.1 TRZ/ATZ family hydrolase [Xanthomonadales bacterium]
MPKPAAETDRITLLDAAHVVPVRPVRGSLPNHSVAIQGDRIAGLMPTREASQRWPDARHVDLTHHALLPGFINAHTHSPMTLLRGYADDMALDTWLREHIWPVEARFVDSGFVEDGTRLAVAEMLRSGTTCFNDMYFFPGSTVEVCREAGMRINAGLTIIEMKSSWAADVEAYIEKGLRLLEQWQGQPGVNFALAPHSPYTVSDGTLERIEQLSARHGLRVHMHLLETEWELKQSLQQHEQTPLERLKRHGLLNQRLTAVHMTQLTADDIEDVAEAGASVVHCPQSNLKLASGFCPVAELSDAGVNVALGTDGAAANNDLDMLGEAQTAALLAKGVAVDAKAVNAFQALEMMTVNGAQALGLEEIIGSIEVGKQADLCALDLDAPRMHPLHHVISQLVYAAASAQVTDVWVAGRRLLKSGALTTIDEAAVIHSAAHWRDRMARFGAAADH